MGIRERVDLGLEITLATMMALICVVVFLGVVFRYVGDDYVVCGLVMT